MECIGSQCPTWCAIVCKPLITGEAARWFNDYDWRPWSHTNARCLRRKRCALAFPRIVREVYAWCAECESEPERERIARPPKVRQPDGSYKYDIQTHNEPMHQLDAPVGHFVLSVPVGGLSSFECTICRGRCPVSPLLGRFKCPCGECYEVSNMLRVGSTMRVQIRQTIVCSKCGKAHLTNHCWVRECGSRIVAVSV